MSGHNAVSAGTSNATAPRSGPNPDRQSNSTTNNAPKTGVVQPRPQALPKRTGPSSIIVSPRQKGNPVLNNIKSLPWEWGDIPADYILGLTTCALFLSLKYHRLHPEYIYTRIKALQGKYLLRIVLVMVDIDNHEESLRELSKTSLINNVTLILCWSSTECARYIEYFKQYEHASPTSIKQHQSNAYSDRMIGFITTPRSINKTDAVSLVSQFGTLRTAVNARHEDVSGIAGWGEKKVQAWTKVVREPFRVQRAAKRGLGREASSMQTEGREASGSPVPVGARFRDEGAQGSGSRPGTAGGDAEADADERPTSRLAEVVAVDGNADEEEAIAEAMTGPPVPPKDAIVEPPAKRRKPDDDPLSDGVMAALSKLRKT